jgi:hypothetical protein
MILDSIFDWFNFYLIIIDNYNMEVASMGQQSSRAESALPFIAVQAAQGRAARGFFLENYGIAE